MSLAQLLDDEFLRLQMELAENIEASGQRATGKTIAALRTEASGELARLLGPAHIGVLETGSGPAKDPNAKPSREMVASIREWLDARGLVSNGAYGLALYILRHGTRLYRGEDKRFSKPTGTLRDVIQASKKRLRQSLGSEVRRSLASEVLKGFTSNTAY